MRVPLEQSNRVTIPRSSSILELMRAAVVVLLAALSVACQDPAVPKYELSPGSPTIQTPTTLSVKVLNGAGEQATQAFVTATLKDQAGRGIAGSLLTFSSSKGVLAPTSAVSNDYGDARTTLTSGTSAMVTVSGAGLSASQPVTIVAPLSVIASIGRLEKRVPATFQATVTTRDAAPPLVYAWDFGDGQTARTSSNAISHTYAEDGRVTVVLTVTDGLERTGTTSVFTVVNDNPEPPATTPPPPAPAFSTTLTCSSQTARNVSCNVSGQYGGAPIPSSFLTKVQWDWGDGSPEVGPVALTHTYGVAGSYTVSVNATWEDAPTEPKTVTVTATATAKN